MSNVVKIHYCSFCHKSSYDLETLIVGLSGNICNECLILCNQIINEKNKEKETP